MTTEDIYDKYNKAFMKFVDEALSNNRTKEENVGTQTTTLTQDMRDKELQIGDILPNGAVVIACTKKTKRIPDDTLATWIAICMKDPNDRDPYVTWGVSATKEGFSAYSGEYSNNIKDAVTFYEDRGGI